MIIRRFLLSVIKKIVPKKPRDFPFVDHYFDSPIAAPRRTTNLQQRRRDKKVTGVGRCMRAETSTANAIFRTAPPKFYQESKLLFVSDLEQTRPTDRPTDHFMIRVVRYCGCPTLGQKKKKKKETHRYNANIDSVNYEY